jgi:hypothetical protein
MIPFFARRRLYSTLFFLQEYGEPTLSHYSSAMKKGEKLKQSFENGKQNQIDPWDFLVLDVSIGPTIMKPIDIASSLSKSNSPVRPTHACRNMASPTLFHPTLCSDYA